jgi:hypothetical protein
MAASLNLISGRYMEEGLTYQQPPTCIIKAPFLFGKHLYDL